MEVADGQEPNPAEARAVFFTARASGATLKQAAAAAGVSRTTSKNWVLKQSRAARDLGLPSEPLTQRLTYATPSERRVVDEVMRGAPRVAA